MILELNIGLHVQRADADNSETAAAVRASRAMRLLAETLALARIFSRVETTRYEHEGKQVVERVLVARAAVRGTYAAIRNHIHRVATALEQDCIAVRWTDADGATRGDLIGPGAAEWGPFDPAYFTPYDDNAQEQGASSMTPLSEREEALVQALADGKSQAEALVAAGYAPTSGPVTLTRIKRRLGVRNTNNLIAEAVRKGWID